MKKIVTHLIKTTVTSVKLSRHFTRAGRLMLFTISQLERMRHCELVISKIVLFVVYHKFFLFPSLHFLFCFLFSKPITFPPFAIPSNSSVLSLQTTFLPSKNSNFHHPSCPFPLPSSSFSKNTSTPPSINRNPISNPDFQVSGS